jgi:hypothetical protein
MLFVGSYPRNSPEKKSSDKRGQLRNRFQGFADPYIMPACTLALVFARDRAVDGQQKGNGTLDPKNKRLHAPGAKVFS